MFTRKTSATPEQLLEQVRAAQQRHAEEVVAANERLIESHQTIYSDASARQSTISEQISLLQAERAGLDKVIATSNPAKVQRAGQ